MPHHIQEHIDYITPGIKLITPTSKSSKKEVEKRTLGPAKSPGLPPLKLPLPVSITELIDSVGLGICDVAILPRCIAAMYNITQATLSHPGNQLGIFEDLGDYYSQTDLNDFFLTLAPNIPQGTHPTLHGIDGAKAPTTDLLDAGPESDLDFQISYPVSGSCWEVVRDDFADIGSRSSIPRTLSSSKLTILSTRPTTPTLASSTTSSVSPYEGRSIFEWPN